LNRVIFSILRIIYPVRTKFEIKLDFLRKPLALFDEGKLYPLFADQKISVSFIDEIVEILELRKLKKPLGIKSRSWRKWLIN
jgi:hypothetical protein